MIIGGGVAVIIVIIIISVIIWIRHICVRHRSRAGYSPLESSVPSEGEKR